MVKLTKSIEPMELIELIGLIKSSQEKNLLHEHFLGIITVLYALRDRRQILFFSCVLRKNEVCVLTFIKMH